MKTNSSNKIKDKNHINNINKENIINKIEEVPQFQSQFNLNFLENFDYKGGENFNNINPVDKKGANDRFILNLDDLI